MNEFSSPENEIIKDEDCDVFETVAENYSLEEEDDEESKAEGEEVKIVLMADDLSQGTLLP